MKAVLCVHAVGLVLGVASIATWFATGAEGYTRWPDRRLERADAPPAAGEADLLAEAGLTEGVEAGPDIQSRFALGLVPGGVDPAHLLSVATVCAAALLASGGTIALGCRRRTCRRIHGDQP